MEGGLNQIGAEWIRFLPPCEGGGREENHRSRGSYGLKTIQYLQGFLFRTLLERVGKLVHPYRYPRLGGHPKGEAAGRSSWLPCRRRCVFQPGEDSLRCFKEVRPVLSSYAESSREQHRTGVVAYPQLSFGFGKLCPLFLDLS